MLPLFFRIFLIVNALWRVLTCNINILYSVLNLECPSACLLSRSPYPQSSNYLLSRSLTNSVGHEQLPMSPCMFLSQAYTDWMPTQRSCIFFFSSLLSFMTTHLLGYSKTVHFYLTLTYWTNMYKFNSISSYTSWWSEALSFKKRSWCDTKKSTSKNVCHIFWWPSQRI